MRDQTLKVDEEKWTRVTWSHDSFNLAAIERPRPGLCTGSTDAHRRFVSFESTRAARVESRATAQANREGAQHAAWQKPAHRVTKLGFSPTREAARLTFRVRDGEPGRDGARGRRGRPGIDIPRAR